MASIMTVSGHGHPGGNLLLSGGRRRLGFEPPQCRLRGPSSSSLPDEALDPECQGPSGGGEPSHPRSKTAEKGPGAQLPLVKELMNQVVGGRKNRQSTTIRRTEPKYSSPALRAAETTGLHSAPR